MYGWLKYRKYVEPIHLVLKNLNATVSPDSFKYELWKKCLVMESIPSMKKHQARGKMFME